MKQILKIYIILSMFIGCTGTCANHEVVVTLFNESSDSIQICIGFSEPTETYYMGDTVPPFSKYLQRDIYSDDLEYEDLKAYIVTFRSIKKYTLDSIIKNHIYDTVYTYSYSELEARDYIIRFNPGEQKEDISYPKTGIMGTD